MIASKPPTNLVGEYTAAAFHDANESGIAAEDEIDWDEDDNKTAAEPVAAAVATGAIGTSAAVPDSTVDSDPPKTTDSKDAGGDAPKPVEGAVGQSTVAKSETVEAPKPDFTMGIAKTDAEKEAEKRAARAKRFGIAETIEATEAQKKMERAKKFGLDTTEPVVKGLDEALPDRRAKRGREGKDDGRGGRNAKRQTPDRRTEAPKSKVAPVAKPKPAGRITDDPTEKAKAEARAKRFAAAT